jgi:folate-dependent phosphoribosylglycinamide formyltransferase PurN
MPSGEDRPQARTVLICHEEDELNRIALARWLGSFTDLAGIVSLRETRGRLLRRIKREVKRVGLWRFPDVLAMRLYYKLFLARRDQTWADAKVAELSGRYPEIGPETRVLTVQSPNSEEAERFLAEIRPDIIVARCKQLLNERIYTLASQGTFVMHPGICPEYRNAHGCFWALARRDLSRVGMTLLRVDRGVDTGPVYGYYSYPFDERAESHIVITHRVVFDNLDSLEQRFQEIHAGSAQPLDTSGRESKTWGQPWLSRYLAWKRAARADRPSA